MKKKLFILGVWASLFSMSPALSAPVGNLKVIGDIKPPTCMVNGTEQTDVIWDFGKVNLGLIPQNRNYELKPASASLEVICESKTYLTITPVDTYNEFSENPALYALVNKENTDQFVGAFSIDTKNFKVDEKNVFWGRSGPTEYRSTILIKNTISGWTSTSQSQVNASSLKLVPGNKFSVDITTGDYSEIYSRTKLSTNGIDLTKSVDYIGNVVLTFNFGV